MTHKWPWLFCRAALPCCVADRSNQFFPCVMTEMITSRIQYELKLSEFAMCKPVEWSGMLWCYGFYL